MAVFWIVYALFCVVIIGLVIKCLSLSDMVKEKDFYIKDYCDIIDDYKEMYFSLKNKYEEDEKIIQNIKDNLSF